MNPNPNQAEQIFARNRAYGRVQLSVVARGTATHRQTVAEEGSLRVRFPNSSGHAEAVLINTAGGVAGGDRFEADIRVEAGASLMVTTAAAEKIYRSLGPDSEIAVRMTVEQGASLSWVPLETILFDRARLDRTLTVELANDATLVLVEAVVFGRSAMGETVDAGSLMDRWRVRRGGRVVYAEGIRVDRDIAGVLANTAAANGAAAIATVLMSPGGDDTVAAVRSHESEFRGDVGISAWNGLAVVRLVARDGAALRHDLMTVIRTVRCPLPRLWLN